MNTNSQERVFDSFNTVSSGMVPIPAGWFLMGSAEGSDAELPVHNVWIDEFLLDAKPVTNAAFSAFVAATGYVTSLEEHFRMQQNEGEHELRIQSPIEPTWRSYATTFRNDHPVVMVSWRDANAYAQWIGKRLPTEAEWEKAARGGLEQQRFPWGDESPEGHATWKRSAEVEGVAPTSPVGAFSPNDYGLYDMVGNVWEWGEDWYSDGYYADSPPANPKGPATGAYRVRRGASWNVREDFRLRCANRGAMLPDRGWPNLGFRCALSVVR